MFFQDAATVATVQPGASPARRADEASWDPAMPRRCQPVSGGWVARACGDPTDGPLGRRCRGGACAGALSSLWKPCQARRCVSGREAALAGRASP